MGNYVSKTIGPGEAVRYVARVSLWNFSAYFLGGGLMIALLASAIAALAKSSLGPGATTGAHYGILFLVLIVVVLFIWPLIARWSTELAITDKRLIAKYGLLSTHSIEIRFDKIETVRVTQGLIGKIFNYGDIVVTGTGSTFDPIRSIANPLAFRLALNQAMEANDSGRARYRESNSGTTTT